MPEPGTNNERKCERTDRPQCHDLDQGHHRRVSSEPDGSVGMSRLAVDSVTTRRTNRPSGENVSDAPARIATAIMRRIPSQHPRRESRKTGGRSNQDCGRARVPDSFHLAMRGHLGPAFPARDGRLSGPGDLAERALRDLEFMFTDIFDGSHSA